MSKFSEIPVDSLFTANSQIFRKISPLSYIDPSEPGLERMASPLFDMTIGEKVADKTAAVDTTAKYIVDPNTRVMSLNPSYDAACELKTQALNAFGEFWGTAYFDCGPEDIECMTGEIINLINFKGPNFNRVTHQPPTAVKKTAKKSVKKAAITKKNLTKKAAKKAIKKVAKKTAKKR
jgi:hypothetical protein